MKFKDLTESSHKCPHCGGPMFSEMMMTEKKDACYYKVKASAKVWPSAYASGRLVQCRKKGASNYGNKSEGVAEDNLKEFAPGPGGGESGRWYTDDQITDIVGDGWYNDLDVSGDIPKQQMIQQAQAWLDDQGYSVQVLNCKVNDDDMEWYIEGSFQNSRFAKKGVAEGELDEGWKETLGAATLAGAMALGSAGAQARVTPDGQGGFTGGMKPAATVTAPVPARIDSPSGPSGFSKEYLQKAADPNRTGRYMISIEKAQELLKQTNEGTAGLPDPNNFDSDWEYQDALDAYGKTQDNDSDFENMTDEPDDWFDESKEKIGNMDADDFDAAMARLKKLAGAGPMKTVYDPDRRVYRNMPTAQQPPKQLKK